MWFAKWFGGRTETEDDEPAQHAAPPIPPGHGAKAAARPAKARKKGSDGKGFDPYNSGAFERRSAWERTNRR